MNSSQTPKTPQTIIHALNDIMKAVNKAVAFTFTSTPSDVFKRVIEKFDSVENYKIRDGF